MKKRGENRGATRVFALFALVVLLAATLTGTKGVSRRAGASSAAGSMDVSQQEAAADWPTLQLSSPISGFTQPVSITHAGDGSGRLFVVEQGGRIRLVKSGALQATPFLDISARVSTGGERGLLGLAFPPGFAAKRYFYVNYTNTFGNTVIARYRVSATNPDAADPASEQVVLTIGQPYANHNGGQLAFSPRDGYLYIGMGDGGSAGDPENRAQNTNELLGKLLRIDVETGSPATYNVPATNPFVGRAGYRPEIWALGLRNPWRFSFDRQTQDLFIADVGQGNWEEINYQPFFSRGGENYGWRVMEGSHCYNAATCSTTGLTLPISEYDHTQGCSVTGGYVYRGGKYPRMQGIYIYGDYCNGRIWGLRRESGAWQNNLLLDTTINISTFGEDETGNLYVASHNTGTIYQLTDTQTPASTVQFDAASYSVTEACTARTITVTRTGTTGQTATVDYTISDGTAKQKSDYTYTYGTLTFAPNETSKTFSVLVTDDAFAEGDETATLVLSNPTGGVGLGEQMTATFRINDNETTNGTTNPIDLTETFVCQHYHDFLNRQSDADGQNFWVSQIAACVNEPACVDDRRQSVSAAFFLSIEFQNTGYLVARLERLSFNRLPRYEQFLRDMRRVGDGVIVGQGDWQTRLEANRQAFTREWVERPEFVANFPATMTAAEFVDALFRNSGASFSAAERDAALAAYGGGGTEGRARAILSVAESASVYNKLYNPSFVLMEYFGYLRRNPEDPPEETLDLTGYNFWLKKMNEHSLPGEDMRSDSQAFGRARRAEMVRSFLVSGEYRQRFGP